MNATGELPVVRVRVVEQGERAKREVAAGGTWTWGGLARPRPLDCPWHDPANVHAPQAIGPRTSPWLRMGAVA